MATPVIFTLTGNLLAERTLEFASWSPGRTQRARRESFQVGGKGINVSKMLGRLGVPNTALCFTGGATGAECDAWLARSRLVHRSFPSTTPTRAGTVVRGPLGTWDAPGETTFLGPDAPPGADAIRACADFLATQPDGALLALCGSMPGWSDASFDPLRTVLRRWLERGTLAIDTYGPPLVELATWPVHLVKINADERASLSTAIAGLPVQRWIVTDGPRDVWLRDRDGASCTLTPPATKEVSATGSGDVLFACVLEQLFLRGASLSAAVAAALPYAAANAGHPGVAEFDLSAARHG